MMKVRCIQGTRGLTVGSIYYGRTVGEMIVVRDDEGEERMFLKERFERVSNKGFASMDKEKQKKIASLGGRAVQQNGNAHTFTEETARKAGEAGGRKVAENRAHMSVIGRAGGLARAKNAAAKKAAFVPLPIDIACQLLQDKSV